MGRADDRKFQKSVKKKLNDKQFDKLMSDINYEYVSREAKARFDAFRNSFLEAIVEAMKENGLSNIKCKAIVDDTERIFFKKVNKVE